jgi:translation initiation factor IF-2
VEDAEAFSDKHNYIFYEVSAKTGEGIEDIFKLLALEIFKNEEGLT